MDSTEAIAPPSEELSIEKTARSYRFLVVDDNEDCAKVMMWTLEMLGHNVQIAFDGKTAVELAKSFLPDVAFLDIGLPVMNGYEICEAMRREPVLRNTVFIALTGWGLNEHRERSWNAGFDYHLVKPIDIETIKNILLELVRKNY